MSKHWLLNEEIALIQERSSYKYPADKYNSPQKRFKIILNELYELGVHADIQSIPQPLKKDKKARPYKYQVELNYEVVKLYKTSRSAKMRIVREYVKRRKNAKVKKG